MYDYARLNLHTLIFQRSYSSINRTYFTFASKKNA